MKVREVTLECVVGDIAMQPDIEAVINAANAQLMPGGGVAGALHRAAGPDLAAACVSLAPIEPGDAVLTDAFALPNRYVIHCLGPVFGRDEPAAELLAACYDNALTIAEENGVSSLAFPAISSGAFGYPMKEGAEIACSTVVRRVAGLPSVERVRFVLFDRRDHQIFASALVRAAAISGGDPATTRH